MLKQWFRNLVAKWPTNNGKRPATTEVERSHRRANLMASGSDEITHPLIMHESPWVPDSQARARKREVSHRTSPAISPINTFATEDISMLYPNLMSPTSGHSPSCNNHSSSVVESSSSYDSSCSSTSD